MRFCEDYEDVGEEFQTGYANGIGDWHPNPIGFGKDIRPPFRLPLKMYFDGRGNAPALRLFTFCNGITYELKPISKQARKSLAEGVYSVLGAKHYEQDR